MSGSSSTSSPIFRVPKETSSLLGSATMTVMLPPKPSTLLGVYWVLSFYMCLSKPFCPSHSIFWDGKNGLKIVWNGLKKKYVEWFDFVNFEVV